MDPKARRIAARVKSEIEAEFAGVLAVVDAKVKDPDEEDFYLWLDGSDAEPDEYADAWSLARKLAEKHWEDDEICFVVKKRNVPEGATLDDRDDE
jgi:hypothetical protein